MPTFSPSTLLLHQVGVAAHLVHCPLLIIEHLLLLVTPLLPRDYPEAPQLRPLYLPSFQLVESCSQLLQSPNLHSSPPGLDSHDERLVLSDVGVVRLGPNIHGWASAAGTGGNGPQAGNVAVPKLSAAAAVVASTGDVDTDPVVDPDNGGVEPGDGLAGAD